MAQGGQNWVITDGQFSVVTPILQATKSIFAPQTSGFVATEGDGGQSPQVLEIIRGVMGTRTRDQ
jgi:hypothetical protein